MTQHLFNTAQNAIIEAFANGYSSTLTYGGTGSSVSAGADDTEEFVVNMIDGSNGILADSSNRAQLIFKLNCPDPKDLDTTENQGARSTLAPGDSVTLTITTAAGGTAFVEKRAPSSLSDGDVYRL